MIIRYEPRPKAVTAKPALLLLLGPLVLSSCAAAPFLVPIAFEFARNLFQTGLSNYGSKHRDNLSNLVNRLASPYMQGLPPMQIGAPGMAGFAGPSPVPGQPGFPTQPGAPQPALPGQPGTFDPNNPYGATAQTNPAVTQYPGMSTTPGTPATPYGTSQGYPSQPGMNSYDPNNPYGSAP